MSGRREDTVRSDSRLMGQTSYIYEAGCAMVIDRERTYLTGEWVPDSGGAPADRIVASGLPDRLFESFRPRLEWHSPWHEGRELSLLFRGRVDVDEVNALIAEREDGVGLRFLDNGAINRRIRGSTTPSLPPRPRRSEQGRAVGAHMRARGYLPEECIAAGDSIEDLGAAEYVGRFFCVANGPRDDEPLREAIAGLDNVPSPRGGWGKASTRRSSRPSPSGDGPAELLELEPRGRGPRSRRPRLLPLRRGGESNARPQPLGLRRLSLLPECSWTSRRSTSPPPCSDRPPPPRRRRADRLPPPRRSRGEIATGPRGRGAGAVSACPRCRTRRGGRRRRGRRVPALVSALRIP